MNAQVHELPVSPGLVHDAWPADQARNGSVDGSHRDKGAIGGVLRGLAAWLAAAAREVGRRLLPWLVPLALLVTWQAASSFGWLSTRVLPAPIEVGRAGWTLAASGELWTHVRVSAGRALGGLAI